LPAPEVEYPGKGLLLFKNQINCMRILFILLLSLSFFFLKAQSAADVYIEKYDSLALEVMNNYGIPASLILGVALHESASGTSKLCRVKHNHFGVKGRVKSTKTKSGYTTSYRSFDTDEDSYLFMGELISHRKYYKDLKDNMDYMKWLKAIKAAGYARSHTWISEVERTIKKNDLTRFDRPQPAPNFPKLQIKDTIPVLTW
jgi:flagellum-specific peptidoglycan hydrolase FlgJ